MRYVFTCKRCDARSKQDVDSFIPGHTREMFDPSGRKVPAQARIFLCDACGCPRTLGYVEVR